jgi:hypothetical protein
MTVDSVNLAVSKIGVEDQEKLMLHVVVSVG